MKTALILLASVLAIGTTLAQEPILQRGQTFVLRLAGVPGDDQSSVSQAYAISDKGTISLLYISEMQAAGLRPSELSRKIEAAYRSAQIFTKPNVTITLGASVERSVSVLGEVNSRRQVAYAPGLTMLDAIAQCGGFSDFAYAKRVKLTRAGKATYHDLSRTTSKDNIQLQPNDIITVPDTPGLLKRLRTEE